MPSAAREARRRERKTREAERTSFRRAPEFSHTFRFSALYWALRLHTLSDWTVDCCQTDVGAAWTPDATANGRDVVPLPRSPHYTHLALDTDSRRLTSTAILSALRAWSNRTDEGPYQLALARYPCHTTRSRHAYLLQHTKALHAQLASLIALCLRPPGATLLIGAWPGESPRKTAGRRGSAASQPSGSMARFTESSESEEQSAPQARSIARQVRSCASRAAREASEEKVAAAEAGAAFAGAAAPAFAARCAAARAALLRCR